MDNTQLTGIVMKHEARIERNTQKADTLEKLFTKHSNRHFQVACLAVIQLLVLIGGLIGLFFKIPH